VKKTLISLFVGITFGSIIANIYLKYEDKSYEIRNYYGVRSKIVKEWDFAFITNRINNSWNIHSLLYFIVVN
jgi:hypothetical protein